MSSRPDLRSLVLTLFFLIIAGGSIARAADAMSIDVGGATRLLPPNADNASAAAGGWTSSDAHVAQVFQNGFVIGLRAGHAQVTRAARGGGRAAEQWTVDVVAPRQTLVDPKSLKQYDDNRPFDANGRR